MVQAFSQVGGEQIEPALTDQKRLVYVIDDDSDVRRSLHFALATSGITVWPFAAPEDFLEQLDKLEPAPVLLDLRMRTLDGMQVLQTLADRGNHWPIVMFSAYGDIPIAVRAMKLGAMDFVEKPVSLAVLEEVLAKSFEALSVVIEQIRASEAAQARLNLLTPRETEILQLLIKGASNKIVAHDLDISSRTVEIHRSNALKKLSVKSLTQVANLMLIKRSSGSSSLENSDGGAKPEAS